MLFTRARRAPAPSPRVVSQSAVASPPPAAPSVTPRRIARDGVTIALEGGGVMRETAPYLEPDRDPRPVTVLLHALCSDEKWLCDWLQWGDLSPQWQLCPRAPKTCGNGGAQWTASGAETRATIERALATTRARHGARVGDRLVLVGMSQGAYAVTHVLRELAARPGLVVRGVVLHGARVNLSAPEVRGMRVVLAAGEQDGAAPAMRALAASLRAQGVEARWASFGKVGHFLPVGTATTMSELIEWARGE